MTGDAPGTADPLAIELALERVEAELAAELPPHMRAFARAHAAGEREPSAPAVLQRATTIAIARRACGVAALAARGRAVMRIAVPVAIELDAAVAAARAAEPTWSGLARLTAARDAAAARVGGRMGEVVRRLHGAAEVVSAATVAAAIAEVPERDAAWWAAADADADAGSGSRTRISDAGGGSRTRISGSRARASELADVLTARFGSRGSIAIVERAAARPRAFVACEGVEVIVVVPSDVSAPSARFAVVHELGHAVAALCSPVALPRIVDEAAAAYVARALEVDDLLPAGWASARAVAARARRTQLAIALDAIERALPTIDDAPALAARPPWALWHDPGAQAAYVGAEAIAASWWRELGPTPPAGAFAAAIARAVARHDDAEI